MNDEIILSSMADSASVVAPAVEWLHRNGVNWQTIVRDSLQSLHRRRHHLPPDRRLRYAQSVVIGEFFARWAAKNSTQSVEDMCTDPDLRSCELRPFELALVLIGDEDAFKKLTPRFARQRFVRDFGLTLGTPEEFSSFVAQNTRRIAKLFLTNFDPARRGAARMSVNYLRVTAVSWYLVRRTRPIRTDAPNLQAYLNGARIRERTRMAVKLAYLPCLLTRA